MIADFVIICKKNLIFLDSFYKNCRRGCKDIKMYVRRRNLMRKIERFALAEQRDRQTRKYSTNIKKLRVN